jgi:hypothetical protein
MLMTAACAISTEMLLVPVQGEIFSCSDVNYAKGQSCQRFGSDILSRLSFQHFTTGVTS